MTISFSDFCFRILIAVAISALLGLERSTKNKPIGVRAFMMVALGSCGFTMLTLNFAFGSMTMGDASVGVDPTRIIQGIIGGIGFLGAGAIMTSSEGGQVRGMGTGAAVWTVGSIGVACALGYLWEAAFIGGVALSILLLSSWLENRAEDVKETVEPSKD